LTIFVNCHLTSGSKSYQPKDPKYLHLEIAKSFSSFDTILRNNIAELFYQSAHIVIRPSCYPHPLLRGTQPNSCLYR
jgi:hypothetical protein